MVLPQAVLPALLPRRLFEAVVLPRVLERVLHQHCIFLEIPNDGVLLEELEAVLLGRRSADQLAKGSQAIGAVGVSDPAGLLDPHRSVPPG